MNDEVTELPADDKGSALVGKEEFEQMKNDMFKFKQQARDAQQKEEAANLEVKRVQDSHLESKEEYKQLWEQGQIELNQAKGDKKEFANLVIKDKKMTAIREAAVRSGINPRMLSLLDSMDTSSVVVETTDHGNFNVLGADQWVNVLKDKYKAGMFPPDTAPIVNAEIGGFDPSDKNHSASDLLTLQKENPAAYRQAMKARTGL